MVAYLGAISGAANITAAATAIRTQLRTTIQTHPAWTLVESVTFGGASAIPTDVYKCAATQSGMTADFYVAVMQSAGQVRLGLAEGYNITTHKPQRPAMRIQNYQISNPATQLPKIMLQADGGLLPATTELDWWNGSIDPGGGVYVVMDTINVSPLTTDDYRIVVSKNGFVLTIRSGTQMVCVGAYDSLVPVPATNDPLPLVIGYLANPYQSYSNPLYAAAIRHPLRGGLATPFSTAVSGAYQWGSTCNGPFFAVLSAWNMGTVSLADADNFDFYVGAPTADKWAILNSYYNGDAGAGRNVTGWLRGSWKLVRHLNSIPSANWGDTVLIDNVLYVQVQPTVFVEVDPL